jgi:tRNA threonylcarbamoyladenosine biosynthesis protein TsaE
MSAVWRLATPESSRDFGAALAHGCPRSGTTVRSLYLQGELGAGKTTIVQGLLHALGVTGPVRSPSYSFIETYALPTSAQQADAPRVAVHVDLYRLDSAAEIETLGLREYFEAGTLVLLEWPERAAELLPSPDLLLTLELTQRERWCRLQPHTAAGATWAAAVLRLCVPQT